MQYSNPPYYETALLTPSPSSPAATRSSRRYAIGCFPFAPCALPECCSRAQISENAEYAAPRRTAPPSARDSPPPLPLAFLSKANFRWAKSRCACPPRVAPPHAAPPTAPDASTSPPADDARGPSVRRSNAPYPPARYSFTTARASTGCNT